MSKALKAAIKHLVKREVSKAMRKERKKHASNGIAGQELAYQAHLAEMRKMASFHPMDLAVGAVLGGTAGAYMANEAYKPRSHTPDGESYRANKLKHELNHQIDIQTNRENPSFADQMHSRIGRAKMRWANIMQDNTALRLLSGAAVGAAAGAVAGNSVGKKLRNSVAVDMLMNKASHLQMADALGISRELVEKKAYYLDVPVEDVLHFELMAHTVNSLPQKTAAQKDFLEKMAFVQHQVGDLPLPSRPLSINDVIATGMPKTVSEGSMWTTLMQKQKLRNQGEASELLAALGQDQISEPEDGRNWTRSERGKELLGIFGGPSEIEEDIDTTKLSSHEQVRRWLDKQAQANGHGQENEMYEATEERLSKLSYAELYLMESGVKAAAADRKAVLLPVVEPTMTNLGYVENGSTIKEAERVRDFAYADREGRRMAHTTPLPRKVAAAAIQAAALGQQTKEGGVKVVNGELVKTKSNKQRRMEKQEAQRAQAQKEQAARRDAASARADSRRAAQQGTPATQQATAQKGIQKSTPPRYEYNSDGASPTRRGSNGPMYFDDGRELPKSKARPLPKVHPDKKVAPPLTDWKGETGGKPKLRQGKWLETFKKHDKTPKKEPPKATPLPSGGQAKKKAVRPLPSGGDAKPFQGTGGGGGKPPVPPSQVPAASAEAPKPSSNNAPKKVNPTPKPAKPVAPSPGYQPSSAPSSAPAPSASAAASSGASAGKTVSKGSIGKWLSKNKGKLAIGGGVALGVGGLAAGIAAHRRNQQQQSQE